MHMYWLGSLLVLGTVLEAVVCGGDQKISVVFRKVACVCVLVLLVVGAIGTWVVDWRVWVWGVPIVAYRIINILRLYQGRLSAPHLRTVSLRAFGWLLAAQVFMTATAWLTVRHHAGMQVLDVLVPLQLLGAVILLRATLHTWRHAGAPNDRANMLSEKELPSLSVLVPARNETDDLQHCLEALVASDYPKLEILALDDCSARRHTPDVIRSFAHQGVRFIQGAEPDETRWMAKNYAYQQLAEEASGDLLLFCGVDALLEPQSIRQLVSLLELRGKDMLSVMPLRVHQTGTGNSVLQAMRYYWEICLPRRLFKRPPVLSTCWLIRREALTHMGGFESVSRSVSPEAALARRAVITDTYGFVRSDSAMGIYSDKPAAEQYDTSVRVRYPQLHRRLELVALASVFELTLLLGPFVGLLLAAYVPHATAYIAIWVVSLLCLFTTYGIVAGGARLTNQWYGWLLMPLAIAVDLVVLHVSLWKYEFGSVDWKGRNVCIPVMQVEPYLPGLPGRRVK